MLTKFLDPKNDVAFRRIFGTERNKDILIDFLNDMITFKGGEPITEVTFLKTVQDPEIAALKTSIVDVLCQDEKGNTYIVEMQVAKERGFEKRAQYYAAKAYSAQLPINGKYHDLKEVIFLAIADFVMFPDKQAYKSDHIILDKVSHEHDLKDFSFTFLELPKLDKSLEESTTKIEKWVYFFKHGEDTPEKDVEHLLKNTNTLYRAYEELNRFSWNEEELRTYEQTEKYEGCYIASMDQKYDEGMEKDRAEGEKKAQLAIAKKLLNSGMDIDTIVSITNLSRKDIEGLK
ncbi:Rpn family recombination-promoting nuclease/putative transposase [Candidatus Finniella inopinata]|uniref:Rpn family recombination-promoting nuclease/putative transposase n=1 Tax=Candidatus Finniella inopinata TaxID=1696036 RepID=A0A4Q7DHP3_9PROT|nr:Rpn family recombination-promoting nuclease/putative transposase [Candidatus Finniella inopinata]RZI45669.1 Rpn family recombination-promoting nuclease/putative transposase [Candidatus Finniella inopinata]